MSASEIALNRISQFDLDIHCLKSAQKWNWGFESRLLDILAVSPESAENYSAALGERSCAIVSLEEQHMLSAAMTLSGRWFGTCFIFPYIGNFIIQTD